jgi:hypothetical protein
VKQRSDVTVTASRCFTATRAFERLVPVLATLSLLFGAWYAAGAV